MNILFVVSHPRDWPISLPGVEIVPARTYLADGRHCNRHATKVFNLCRSCRYQKRGYYVSLLGEARGHRPVPDVKAIEDVQTGHAAALVTDSLSDTIQASLAGMSGDSFTLTAWFGRDAARRHEQLAEQLFNLLHLPLLRVHFTRQEGRWAATGIDQVSVADLAAEDWPAVVHAAEECLHGHREREREPAARRPSLAILHSNEGGGEPSNADAILKFQAAAETLGMRVAVIGKHDIDRLAQFDALFIRDTTGVNHHTYRFSRRAALSGMVVIDDPDSILRCNNKVYLAELLARHGIAAPKTLLVHRDNVERIVPELGLPCVLKQPDSAFSAGVVKVETQEALASTLQGMFDHSELVLAQEYLPTEFDWRIGILDRRPLFACRYFMVPGHWQIVQHLQHDSGHSGYREGSVEAVALDEAPPRVVATALAAANLLGVGFYGVDLKQHGQHCCVIEVNDNPNVDAGNEDGVLGDALYREVMDVFRRRIEASKGGIAP
jgi:glutathione synthase/RimK-type ligase-like ATP-grasp enzyme